jgi:DNA polymerase elongation subunit (family B)
MSYKSCFVQPLKDNNYKVHLWDDGGYQTMVWNYHAYVECDDHDADKDIRGLRQESLRKVNRWEKDNSKLHFHDIRPYQRFLVDKYGTNDEPSTTHQEVFFDIECEMGGALTEDYIRSAPKPITSIAWWHKQTDEWKILILDKKSELQHDKEGNREIIPLLTEEELLQSFIIEMRKINPDILVGYNSDYFDIPYLYYRICNVFDKEVANMLSPIGFVMDESEWNRDSWLKIAGTESLDYMKLHKKFSFRDEPSFKLDALGKKYVGLEKIEYEGSLDRLFKEDKQKFIAYNFRDVEILKALDEKFQYLPLTKNLAHKGKINYSDVYKNSMIHDGAISAYLLSQGIIPPSRDKNPITKQNYAGGYLFCPQAGLYKYMFDEDLTSLYPSIIMSLNIGKETLVGRVIIPNEKVVVEGKEIFNCRYGLNDLKKLNPETELILENSQRKRTKIEAGKLVKLIEDMEFAVSANGVMYRTDFDSVLKTILAKWFDERVLYKNKMKEAYKAGDKEKGAQYHLLQHTMKILLNSLYGATALGSFRYGNVILSESITLSGQRIIQESALFANTHMNKVMKGELTL